MTPCTNVDHLEAHCSDAEFPLDQWCKPCLVDYTRSLERALGKVVNKVDQVSANSASAVTTQTFTNPDGTILVTLWPNGQLDVQLRGNRTCEWSMPTRCYNETSHDDNV